MKDSSKKINPHVGNLTKSYYCSHCKIPGNSLESCFKANPNRLVCSNYHMHGHATNTCYKIHGYPKGHKLYGKSRAASIYANQGSSSTSKASGVDQNAIIQEQYTQLMALL